MFTFCNFISSLLIHVNFSTKRQNRRLRSLPGRQMSVLYDHNDTLVQPRMYSVSSKDMYLLSGTERDGGRTNIHGLTVGRLFSVCRGKSHDRRCIS